jgi:hypothetical protein
MHEKWKILRLSKLFRRNLYFFTLSFSITLHAVSMTLSQKLSIKFPPFQTSSVQHSIPLLSRATSNGGFTVYQGTFYIISSIPYFLHFSQAEKLSKEENNLHVKNTSYIHPKCNKTSFTSSLV